MATDRIDGSTAGPSSYSSPARAASPDDSDCSDSTFPSLSKLFETPKAEKKQSDEQKSQRVKEWVHNNALRHVAEEGKVTAQRHTAQAPSEHTQQPRKRALEDVDSQSGIGHEPPSKKPSILSLSDPQGIYQRYTAKRSAWYQTQPRGSLRTDKTYREAMDFPPQYSKEDYKSCLDYKRMSRSCATGTGHRAWTMEEMTAYLDWDKEEDKRIDGLVALEFKDKGFGSGRRGVSEVWRRIDREYEEQQVVCSASEQETE